MLTKHNMKCVGLPSRKVSILLRPVRGDLELRTPGVYNIRCECGHVYIRQTGRSKETRKKEHDRHMGLGYAD
jgi:hypothetical protein